MTITLIKFVFKIQETLSLTTLLFHQRIHPDCFRALKKLYFFLMMTRILLFVLLGILGRGKSAAFIDPSPYSSVWTPTIATLEYKQHDSQADSLTMKCSNIRPPYPATMRPNSAPITATPSATYPRPPIPASNQPGPFAAPSASASFSGSPSSGRSKNKIDKSDISLCFLDPVTSPCKAVLLFSDTIYPFCFCNDNCKIDDGRDDD